MKNEKKEKLDGIVLDIEFLLISVVQGVALISLADSAIEPIRKLEWQFFPYILCAFLFILIFWSQAIIHALSFIDWPLDIMHSFFYFLVSFIEVLAFHQVTNPFMWFLFTAFFFIAAEILYLIDLQMIKKRKQNFSYSPKQKDLYQHIETRQLFEAKTLVPLGIGFSIAAAFLIATNPHSFLDQKYHLGLVFLQVVFILVVLVNSLKSFRKRSSLISQSIEK